MDNHFGKQKYRSGNIPFTMFGPFDQKANILFKDATDSLKTKYEFTRITNFERNLENYFDSLLQSEPLCSFSYSMRTSKVLILFTTIAALSVFKFI